MKTLLILILSVLIPMFITSSCAQRSETTPTISPTEAQKLAGSKNVLILDVRTETEFASGHVKDALLIPVQELDARLSELEKFKQKKIIAVCRSGNRSGRATTLLREHGFDAVNMSGGMIEWNSLGYTSVKETR